MNSEISMFMGQKFQYIKNSIVPKLICIFSVVPFKIKLF